MTPVGTGQLWQAAEARWAQIAGETADLADAIALQRQLLRILLDTAEALDADPVFLPPDTFDAIESRWIRGVPALRNATIAAPAPVKAALPELCRALVNAGAGDAVSHVRDALANGTIDAESLLRVSLARNEKAVRTSALHMGLSPDLVWLIGELGSSPLAYHAQRQLLGRPHLAAAVNGWDRGYCPCCGSWPAFIEVIGEQRLLRCSYCAAAWALASRRCVYCGNGGEDFRIAAPDVRRQGRTVELCGACGNYTKAIGVEAPAPFPLLAIEDLGSVDLDQGAMLREYGRPRLVDLDAIEPAAPGGCS